MNWVRYLQPRLSTVVLLSMMVLLWIPIVGDWLDDLEDGFGELIVPLLLAVFVGLVGVYAATAALESPRTSRKARLLFFVFLRTIAIAGIALLLASLLGE